MHLTGTLLITFKNDITLMIVYSLTVSQSLTVLKPHRIPALMGDVVNNHFLINTWEIIF